MFAVDEHDIAASMQGQPSLCVALMKTPAKSPWRSDGGRCQSLQSLDSPL